VHCASNLSHVKPSFHLRVLEDRSIADFADVENGEVLAAEGNIRVRIREKEKIKLTEKSTLIDELEGPRSSYSSNPSTLRWLLLALFRILVLLLQTGTTALDSCLWFLRLPTVDIMKVEIAVLGRLEQILRVPWMWAGKSLAAHRICGVLFGGMILLHPLGKRKIVVTETPKAEPRRGESLSVNERIALIG
jgi:hypothetical protein